MQQSEWVHVAPLGHIFLIPRQPVFTPSLAPKCCVLNREAANTNFIVFGLTLPGLKPITYHTWGENINRNDIGPKNNNMLWNIQNAYLKNYLVRKNPPSCIQIEACSVILYINCMAKKTSFFNSCPSISYLFRFQYSVKLVLLFHFLML